MRNVLTGTGATQYTGWERCEWGVWVNRWRVSLVVVAGVIAAGGCAQSPKKTAAPDGGEPIAWFIADNQAHEAFGEPLGIRNSRVDAVVPVTRRPPAQVLYSDETLRAAANRYPSAVPVVHLGDAIDISCRSEWSRFLAAMDAAEDGATNERFWMLVVGNHDGFFLGNFDPEREQRGAFESMSVNRLNWERVCSPLDGAMAQQESVEQHRTRPQQRMNKADVLKSYLSRLHRRYGLGQSPRSWEPGGKDYAAYRIAALRSDFGDGMLHVMAEVDEEKPWGSYLLQVLEYEKGTQRYLIVGIDTASYSNRPGGRCSTAICYDNLAGVAGEFSETQEAALDSLLGNLEPGVIESSVVLVAGHHPARALGGLMGKDGSRKRLAKLLGRLNATYVSAHTHKGGPSPARRTDFLTGDFEGDELNVGSIVDGALHGRILLAHGEDGEKGHSLRRVSLVEDCPVAAWKLPKSSPASPERHGWWNDRPTIVDLDLGMSRLGSQYREMVAFSSQLRHELSVVPLHGLQPVHDKPYLRDGVSTSWDALLGVLESETLPFRYFSGGTLMADQCVPQRKLRPWSFWTHEYAWSDVSLECRTAALRDIAGLLEADARVNPERQTFRRCSASDVGVREFGPDADGCGEFVLGIAGGKGSCLE